MRKSNRGFVIAATLGFVLVTGAARANDDGGDDAPGGRFCTATTITLAMSCQAEAKDDFSRTKALCINLDEKDERAECLLEAKRTRLADRQTCREQRVARRELCEALGEAPYHPEFDVEEFDDDFENPTNPNLRSQRTHRPSLRLHDGNARPLRSGETPVLLMPAQPLEEPAERSQHVQSALRPDPDALGAGALVVLCQPQQPRTQVLPGDLVDVPRLPPGERPLVV